MTAQTANIAAYLPQMAATRPHALAIVFPQARDAQGKRAYTHYTYRQLDQRSDEIARGLMGFGIQRGHRAVLMVRPSLEFFALAFGLFKAGIVPVLIDPGLGVRQLKQCLAEAEPHAFIGIPQAHLARVLLGWGKPTVKRLVTVGRRYGWGGATLAQIAPRSSAAVPVLEPTQDSETAAILFTSGSTGVAKGVVYAHGHFIAQVQLIQQTYDIQPGEIDLPTFPLFALFDPALGMTTIVPDMDATKPAKVNPRKIHEAIEDFGVTNVFGSPALLQTVSLHAAANGIVWPTVKRVISAGAPVPAATLQRVQNMLTGPEAQIFTPYGATESLPLASIGSLEVLAETRAQTERGAGVCVGKIVAPMDVRIIEITDDVLTDWADVRELAVGEIGEIAVTGPVVTQSYLGRPKATQLAKIRREGQIVHRMGDVGYFDAQDRLWFCGRKSHRVQLADKTLFSTPIEEIFNVHPQVSRTALVGVLKNQWMLPVLCVELLASADADPVGVIAELRQIGRSNPDTQRIETFLVHPEFPVDIRHNAKIGREKLAIWAAARLK